MIPGILIVVALVAWPVSSTVAQSFPSRPIRFIVPFPAGGGADLWARVIGQKLTEAWGQNVIVDNRGGASGIIGTEIASKAAPDGHTLLMGTTGTHATNPVVFSKLHSEIVRMLKLPDVRQRIATEGAGPIGNAPAEFAAQVQRDITKWGKVARESGIRAE